MPESQHPPFSARKSQQGFSVLNWFLAVSIVIMAISMAFMLEPPQPPSQGKHSHHVAPAATSQLLVVPGLRRN